MADLKRADAAYGGRPAVAGVRPATGKPNHAPTAKLNTRTTPVSWLGSVKLTVEEWRQYGARLGGVSKSSNWWLGDWVRFGQRRFGLHYEEVARGTGYDVQTLMNIAYVAGRFEISRRREILSWSHHADLAALTPAEQDRWLNMAITDNLTVQQMRTKLRAEKRSPASSQPHRKCVSEPMQLVPVDASETIVCPHCGASFTLDGLDAHAGGSDSRAERDA